MLIVWLLRRRRRSRIFVPSPVVTRATAVATTIAAAATAFAALITATETANQAAHDTQYNDGSDNYTGNDRPFAISLGHTIIPTGKRRLHRASFVGNASL